MLKSELNNWLQKFCLCARKPDGTYYNKTSLTAITANIYANVIPLSVGESQVYSPVVHHLHLNRTPYFLSCWMYKPYVTLDAHFIEERRVALVMANKPSLFSF